MASAQAKISRYTLLEEIGRGGFGAVFKAHDPVMDRVVAIKLLSTAAEEDMLRRFRNEAAAAGNLRHPSIVTIYDFGEENGQPFLVMEFLSGIDLQRRIREGAIRLLDATKWMMQVAEGLATAHAHSIFHRDIKPANIMISPDGGAKITDFGIARAAARFGDQTRTGFLVGTPQYMAPELFEGQKADAQTDIWSAGVIFHELLGGGHPFPASDTPQLLSKLATASPPELSVLEPSIPLPLSRLVRRMLTRERSLRYQSFQELLIDLRPVYLDLLSAEHANLLHSSRRAASQGNYAEAKNILKLVLDSDPRHQEALKLHEEIQLILHAANVQREVDSLLLAGDRLFDKREFANSLEIYRRVLQLDPRNTPAQTRIAKAAARQEEWERSRGILSEALDAWNRGDLVRTEASVERLLAHDPANAEALRLRDNAVALREKQRLELKTSRLWQARQALASHNLDAARPILEASIRDYPSDPEVLVLREELNGALAALNSNPHTAAFDPARILFEVRDLVGRRDWPAAELAIGSALEKMPCNLELLALRESVGAKLRDLSAPPAIPEVQNLASSPVGALPSLPAAPPTAARRFGKGFAFAVAGMAFAVIAGLGSWISMPKTDPPPSPSNAPTEAQRPSTSNPNLAAQPPQPVETKAKLGLSPASLNFVVALGAKPRQLGDYKREVKIDSNRLDWRLIEPTEPWLEAKSVNESLWVQLRPSKLSAGIHSATLKLLAHGAPAATLPITVRVDPAATDRSIPEPIDSPKTIAPIPVAPQPSPDLAKASLPPYLGPRQGTLTWTGQLPPKASVVIGVGILISGGGALGGRSELPNVFSVAASSPAGLEVQTQQWPAVPRLTVTNTTGAALNFFTITWQNQQK